MVVGLSGVEIHIQAVLDLAATAGSLYTLGSRVKAEAAHVEAEMSYTRLRLLVRLAKVSAAKKIPSLGISGAFPWAWTWSQAFRGAGRGLEGREVRLRPMGLSGCATQATWSISGDAVSTCADFPNALPSQTVDHLASKIVSGQVCRRGKRLFESVHVG